jgi:hypothetical protein
MEIRVGDRLTDEQGEWEVDTHPAALHGGKSLHARLRKVGACCGEVRYVAGSRESDHPAAGTLGVCRPLTMA